MKIRNLNPAITKSPKYPLSPSICFKSKLKHDKFTSSRLDACVTPLIKEDPNTQNISRDGFTGLRDKKCLLNRLNEKIQEGINSNENISVAMFDMDNFKSVNELLGYETGDEFIKQIGSSIQEVARNYSLGSYRFGGEEFVLIFKGKTKEEIEQICKQIQEKINSQELSAKFSKKYIENANSLLSSYKESNLYMENINNLKIEKEFLLKLMQENPEIFSNDITFKKLDEIENILLSYYRGILKYASKKEKDRSTLNQIEKMYKLITRPDSKEMLDFYTNDEFLANYLFSRFDKTAQIAQVKIWLGEHIKNNGFTITCGVYNVPCEKLKEVNATDIMNEAGEILKYGKHVQKGQIYFVEKE